MADLAELFGKVVALAGGVGGAKLADGLAQMLPPENLTIVVNTGDDFDYLGLRICPDLDTVCYTLAGLANPATGWGRIDETWNALDNLRRLGGPDWFGIGDKDLGTHLDRTRRLKQGECLSQITRDFCQAWGIQPNVLPATDEPLATWVETAEQSWLPFQVYFVKEKCQPRVKGFRFAGVETARPAPGVREAIEKADWVIFCPSNPWVSIGPILALEPLQEILKTKKVAAVSPIVGGQAVKGPAAKMYAELGIKPSALAVAQQYQPLVNLFVMDIVDQEQSEAVKDLGLTVLVTDTIMKTTADRKRLAEEVLDYCNQLDGGKK